MSFACLAPSQFCAHSLRYIALLLVVAFGWSSVAYAAGAHYTLPPSPQAIHQQLSKRGLGKGVKVIRSDGSSVKGHVAALSDDTVDLQPSSGQVITIPLSDVKKVANTGLSKGAKIGIGIGAGLLAVGVVGAIVVSYAIY